MRVRPPIELTRHDVTVRFEWTGDRYRHDILIGGNVVARSIEGGPQDDVPPSPPLQDLSREHLGGDVMAIMGVGGAGRGHWSISVTASERGLLFELACRGSVPNLTSRYERVGEVAIDPLPTATVDRRGEELVLSPVERLVGTSVWSYEVGDCRSLSPKDELSGAAS